MKFTSMRFIGGVLLAIGAIYLFSPNRQIYEAFVWIGLGVFLLARFNQDADVKYRRARMGLVWAGLLVATGAFLIEIIAYVQKLLTAAGAV